MAKIQILRLVGMAAMAATLCVGAASARVERLEITRREPVLNGKAWGNVGAYEKLVGKVHFALDPKLDANKKIVDLNLAPKNAKGEVEVTADFYMLKPVDTSKGNGRLFDEVGNRGGKSMMRVFQQGTTARDFVTEEDYGNGALMKQGYTMMWVGWQWDVPEGQMRMDMPIATNNGQKITGLVRGNFIPNADQPTQPLADRNHHAYAIDDINAPENVMTVRDEFAETPTVIPRSKWHFVGDSSVALDGGFQLGRIYDVVYHARDPRVVGLGLAGERDLVSFMKHDATAPMPGLKYAYGWGVSQTGRTLRHIVYEGFNEDEQGRIAFDGIMDEVGGAGRGSFNHRFAQASRDAQEYFNVMFPADMFPFTDATETDPVTGKTDSLLAKAIARHVVPKMFHIFSNSEYFNRGGSLVHTDVMGTRDIAPPPSSRIYFVSSGPHAFGPMPPVQPVGGAGLNNPVSRNPVIRALLRDMDEWVTRDVAPPASRIPHIADGTLVPTAQAGWPKIPGIPFPVPNIKEYRLDFGPDWDKGIAIEPAKVGQMYVNLVPAVDANGNSRAGIRLPAIEVPAGTYGGWNFRDPAIAKPQHLFGEIGSFHPFARTKEEREASGDSRVSIAERYKSREEYVAKADAVAKGLVKDRLLLAEDEQEPVQQAAALYDWASNADRKLAQVNGKPAY